jgi:arylsulfatase A-like enzyme
MRGQANQPGSLPADRGFQKSFVLLGDGANHFNDREYVPGWPVIFTENNTVVPRPDNNTKFSNEIYTDKILDYLKSNQADGKPFFAYLSFQVAHTPFMAPPALIDKYDKIYSVGWDKLREQRFEKQKELGFWPSNMTNPGGLPPNQAWDNLTSDQKAYAARVFAVHASGIEDMDKNIGRVIQYLKDSGQYDNTFILFTSDNGSSEPFEMTHFKFASGVNLTQAKEFAPTIDNSLKNLGAANSDFNYGPWGSYLAVSPLSGFKSSFYEGGIRIPLVIKGPQAMSSATSNASTNLIKAFVFVKDLTPTMLDLAGVSHPSTYKGHEVAPMEGKSLKGLLEGKVDKVYADDETIPLELFNQTSVRMGDWVGIHDTTDKEDVWKLYNLANDLAENTNVADQHSDIIQTMKTAYDKYAQRVGVVIPTSGAFSTLFPAITANNTQTIDLEGMLAPGYFKGELNPVGSALN